MMEAFEWTPAEIWDMTPEQVRALSKGEPFTGGR